MFAGARGGGGYQPQIYVLKGNSKRETGSKAVYGNIQAATTIASVVRTTLGPRAMLKMILDQMGTVQLTSDGNAILREIDVTHPAAKSMIELSRTQDEEVGDGTTSVIILSGEILEVSRPLLERNIHQTKIVNAYFKALEDATNFIQDKMSRKLDVNNYDQVKEIVRASIGTKFTHRYSDLMCQLAIGAIQKVAIDLGDGKKDIDIKRYVRVEKIPGGSLYESEVLNGVMLNKDILHPKMKRRIENPRIVLLDCPLEYKKGESETNVVLEKEEDFETLLRMEDEYIKRICNEILQFNPDLVITEKGCSDLAAYYLMKRGVSVLRRVKKTDNNRIARATGAKIVNRTSELREEDIGTGAGLFEVRKIGDEYFSYIVDCKDPKACTIVLRGGSKDILNEIERNLEDALHVVKNIFIDPNVVPGGGAVEMSVASYLNEKAKNMKGVEHLPYETIASALEVIPRTLAENCGAHTIRLITELRAKHTNSQNLNYGIDGMKGEIRDMTELGVWEPIQVKTQTIKTAIEAACMILRIDDVLSGLKNKQKQ